MNVERAGNTDSTSAIGMSVDSPYNDKYDVIENHYDNICGRW